MAKTNPILLSPETEIEVIKTNGTITKKKTMPYGDDLKLKKQKGWNYIFYQLGFSQFN